VIIIWRVVRAGLIAALAVGVAGWALERERFGGSDQASLARIETELQQRFDSSAATLGTIATRMAGEREAIRAAPRDPDAARRLFDAADAAVGAGGGAAGRTGVTIYDAARAPLAWAGHVSEPPTDRLEGPSVLYIAPGALGPRLVFIEAIVDRDRPRRARRAVVVVEQLLEHVQGTAPLPDMLVAPTSIVPVSLRIWYGDGTSHGPYSFPIRSRDAGPLLEANVAPADLAAVHGRWRSGTRAAVWSVLGTTLLLCAGPLVELRRRGRDRRAVIVLTGGLMLTLVIVRLMFSIAARPIIGPRTLTSPLDLLLDALVIAALSWLALDLLERRRVARPRLRLLPFTASSLILLAVAYAATGIADAGLLTAYQHFLQRVVSATTLDLLHSLLHPVSATRLTIAFALALLHAGVLWTGVTIIRLPILLGRAPRTQSVWVPWAPWAVMTGGWIAGTVFALFIVNAADPSIALLPLAVSIGVTAGCAVAAARLRRQARRASQAARLIALFVALLVPAIAMYPSLLAFAVAAKERLVENEFAPQAESQREDLQERLQTAADQIDSIPSLADLVRPSSSTAAGTTDWSRAFHVWSQTDLATYRLTSAVELHATNGRLVSRFFLNLPEYEAPTHLASRCEWDLVEDVSPLGSSERHVLRASRGICEGGRAVGSIVVRVMLDYRTLPFVSSRNPYLEWFGLAAPSPAETMAGRDVEFAVYGWSGAPIYTSGTSVWSLPDAIFRRLTDSRQPFWATLSRNDERFRVHFRSDRGGIYALGYPEITWFHHLVNLAELMTLAGVLYIALVAGATVFGALTSRTPASGRALLREVRSSFYRKLFLAFVAAAVVPVVILALATRAYFAGQLRAGIDDAAAKTVTIAQRLVEDYAALQQRVPGALATIDDQMMVIAARAIDEHVNLFDRANLQATSEPYLFASQLLSTRTPSEVYRTIVLDRRPTFVGVEEVGGFQGPSFRLAAAPVRAGAFEGIVTVPLESKQQETDRQIDELDRRVLFAGVLFSLLGAALGYWMAQRIADPVNRLTRATRRIARGDLNARIAATSSDELRRLVEDFNSMADDLKRQRAELERTQRLEAWAEMARQVAHDIKNPLTPIQLSAEHARRVNLDRGRPLSPVLDECVNTILAQVKLLRQISAEFSSFASAPTPRPEPTELGHLIEEVVAPYRMGLAGRIDIEVETPSELPSVTIDRTLFGRALTNVIENALHAMPGPGRLTISARPVESELSRAVVVDVTDTGVGMDQDAVARSFEPYFSTKATGTGLGLTIAKRNVELNGGTISVRSQRGVGTTVTIGVPAGVGNS
jgi:signal transduction histidine kinase